MRTRSEHVVHTLAAALADRPNATALKVDGRDVTRAELLRKASAVAAGLRAHDVEPGASVGLLLVDSIPLVECLYGGWLNGNVLVPINTMLTSDQLAYVIRDNQLRALVVSDLLLPWVEAAIKALDVPLVFVVGNAAGHVPYTRLLESPTSDATTRAGASAHVLTLIAWSAEMRPMGAILTSQALHAQLALARDVLDATDNDCIFCAIPLWNAIGLSVLHASIACGATLVLHRRFKPSLALAGPRDDTVNTLVGVPSMYANILREAERGLLDLRRLRRCISVGPPLSTELAERWERHTGIVIHEAYALTEAAGFVCFNDRRGKRGSVGHPRHASIRVRVVDASHGGAALPANQIGVVRVCGPMFASGYVQHPQETALVFRDGWLSTGDRGYVDADGDLFIADGPMIGRPGGRFIPSKSIPVFTIEALLCELSEVSDCAVCIVPGGARGGHIRAVLALRKNATLDQSAIEAKLRVRLHEDHLPDEYLFVAELPRNAAGMICRRTLRELPSPASRPA